MRRKFYKKDAVLWLHPLGMIFCIRIVSTGRSVELGDFAIINVGKTAVAIVSQSSLMTFGEVTEKNKMLAEELQIMSKRMG